MNDKRSGFELNENELDRVNGGLRTEGESFGWHWGDDWGDGSYWDDTGAVRELSAE